MKKVKYALVQGGGGFKGTFQLGALNFLNDHWKQITGLDTPMRFDLNTGVSVGALNGIMVAMNKLPELNNLWLNQVANNGVSEIYTSEFLETDNVSEKLKFKVDLKALLKRLLPRVEFKLGFFEKMGLIFSKKKRKNIFNSITQGLESELKLSVGKIDALADNMPLRRKMEKLIDRTLINGTFKCGFVSLNSGKYHSVAHTDFVSNHDLVNGIIASSSIPVVWKPVESIKFLNDNELIESKYNVDGGLMNMSPLGDAIRMINQDPEDCEWKIIVINCHSGVPTEIDASQKSIFGLASRAIYELTLGEIFNNDIDHFLEMNHLVKQAKYWNNEIVLLSRLNNIVKRFDAVIINPDPSFDIGNPLVSTKRLIQSRYDHGYAIAASKKYFE
jgi:NTE family protein